MTARRRAPASFDEARAVALFRRSFAQGAPRGLVLGIGDDAAVLKSPGEALVWTVDASVEGTHFERSLLELEDVGYRSFQAAASDLAAMAARPLAALSALTLPSGFSPRELSQLTRGQAAAARSCRCPIVGGNVARSEKLTLTTSVLGVARHPLTRSGARPGDECWLVGAVGLAAAGFELLRLGKAKRSPELERAVAAWRRPRALLARGVELGRMAHAVIDVSDGLGGDAARIAQASGCRLVIEERALRRALPRALGAAALVLRREPLELALNGGEDYALVAAGPPRLRPTWARRIGRFERGRGGVLEREDGRIARLTAGFDHFAG